MTCEEKARKWDETQAKLTELADQYEEVKVYLHRDLATLPQDYADTMRDYLAEAASRIKLRKEAEAWEEKFEKCRGELFDALHKDEESRKYAGERKP